MNAYDLALLVLRLCLGLTMAAHGYNKITAPGGLAGTASWFDGMGMKPGPVHARLAAGSEIGFGLALALGLLTPVAAAGFVALMLVAGWTVHRGNGFFIVRNGWEYNLILAVAAVAVAMLGAGRFSIDRLLFGPGGFDGWPGLLVAAGVGLVAGIGQLTLFYRPPSPAES
ncbi:DoxX family protein [Nocardia rhamnosiphila]